MYTVFTRIATIGLMSFDRLPRGIRHWKSKRLTGPRKEGEHMTGRTTPKFANEAEEAEWWDNHRDMVSREFVEAGKRGELKILTKEKLRERLAARPVTIRLSESDIELARKQAEEKGLPYQTYIKSLLHETLTERKRAGRKRA